jgi:xylulokinase
MEHFSAHSLTIDVGTSSLKAVVFDPTGNVEGQSSRSYSYQSPNPGWAEMDPEVWWTALQDAISDLKSQGFDLDKVAVLAFTGQMHSAVLLDKSHNVIAPVILWLDRRATSETQELFELLDLPPYQLNSSFSLPKLFWLRKHQPEILQQVDKILWPKDYLRYRLTGELCTDLSDAGLSGLLDWKRSEWALDRLELVGLKSSVLPPILSSSASGGKLQPEAAQTLGLNPATKVAVGMGDAAALYGGAPAQVGRITYSHGSSSMGFAPLEPGITVPDHSYDLHVFPFGPYPMLGGVSTTTGMSLTWFYENVIGAGSEENSFTERVNQALETEPGAGGLCFIPYLAGERNPYWNDDLRAGFYGLQLTHDHRHMLRAVMEGVGFSLLHFLDIFAEKGNPISEIALSGGGSTTPGWAQIMADICQRPVLIYSGKETVTRVLYAIGEVHLERDSFDDALLRTFAQPERLEARVEHAAAYQTAYQRYRSFSRFALEQTEK